MHAKYVIKIDDGSDDEDDVLDARDMLLLKPVHDRRGVGKGACDNVQDLCLAAILLNKVETKSTGSRFDLMSEVICG